MSHVILKNLEKRFGDTFAVRPTSLSFAKGEFVVLVGPSGCGKSTTLRMIAGLEDATGGQISIAGRNVTGLEPRSRNVAMVFQNYALYPHKTIYKNLAFGLQMARTPKDEIDRRVRWAAGILGIDHLLERKPKQLSGGQMQRVALGRAMVREPDVFLLDEPLSNLDAKLRARMRDEIAKLHQQIGSSMIYVTHDQVEAMTLGDRIVVMKDGVVQQVGSPLEVYDRPANRFVAGFIGSPEMNFLEGHLAAENGCPTFRAGELAVPLTAMSVAARPGTPVVLGIRPEHISLPSDSPIRGEASLVEQMGAQTVAAFQIGGVEIRAVVDRDDTLRSGDVRSVRIDPTKTHLFEKESGMAFVPTKSREEVTYA
ncbi:ABC transporter ATP-binding protein [Algihabitans albus]|uniref:ABC transporter ATP-binding protein n=1 Tax=Algihabitans albus TaxID=2164067 RepID=UPI000E5CACAF|nr:ABC transporter ATP-binding protein [Algihabitans albus]